MKKCTKCNLEKDESLFSFANKKKGTLQASCKQCVKEYDKKSYNSEKRKFSIRKAAKAAQSRIRDYIDNYRKQNKCVKCGENRWYVLEFHHILDKKYNIAEAIQKGISIKTLQIEIKKCVILCANCHRELHYKERLVDNPSD